jgi:hypothetical protein
MDPGFDEAVRELQTLTIRHAQLRDDLERYHSHVVEIERMFLAMRPQPAVDEATVKELKRKMVLSRPWREELNIAYRNLLTTVTELDGVVRQIQQCQNTIARHFAGR